MESLINTIFYNNHFVFDESINGFNHDDKSYFFIRKIGADELEEIKNKNCLEDQTWHIEFLSNFNEKAKDPNFNSLEKNSSLLILVESSSINDIERLQSQILLIEEDQYYVKKYVIIYTPDALTKISNFATNSQLQSALNNRTSFQSISSNGYNKENEDYILLLQLFIKLPFLTLKFSEDEFVSLPEKLETNLGEDLLIFQQLLDSNEQLQNIDFTSLESESEIDNLLTLLTNDPN
ncbi:MAG: ABC-three component system middle component 1 [Fluviicola sp.]